MWPLLLALTTLMPVSVSSTTVDLPAPTNVHIDSYNMKHILRWDPVPVPDAPLPVTYRVECELRISTILMCENITETHCDFTQKIQHFWRATYKVRAELGERRSAWAEVREFQANKHSKIGPVQSLILAPRGNSITVDYLPPFPPVSDAFRFKYRLYYWKEGADDKMEVYLALTHHMLDNLEEQTVYCVQVKASTEKMEGQTSDPKCAKTMTREYSGRDLALIVTIVAVVCGLCCLAGYMIYRKHAVLKRLLYPPFRMPFHIQEFLDDPPLQLSEVALDHSDTNEHDDSVSVIELTVLSEVDQTCDDPNLVPAEKT